jgi:hypothetical protein
LHTSAVTNAGSVAGNRINPFAFYGLRNAVPAYVALVVLFVADATVENVTALGLILLCDIAGMFAAWSYLEAGDRGARRQLERERFHAALDATERKARRAAARLPLGVAIAISVIVAEGLPDVRVAAAATAVGFLLTQLTFAIWLNARHSSHRERR